MRLKEYLANEITGENRDSGFSKTTMADEDKKFGDEETIKLIKFLEQNPDMLKSSNRIVRVYLKERLRDHFGKFLTF